MTLTQHMTEEKLRERVDNALNKFFVIGEEFSIWDIRVAAGISPELWAPVRRYIELLTYRDGILKYTGARNAHKNSKKVSHYRLLRKPMLFKNKLNVTYKDVTYTFNFVDNKKSLNRFTNVELIDELKQRMVG